MAYIHRWFFKGLLWYRKHITFSCFPLGLEGTFAFYTFPTFWQRKLIMLKMKVVYLKFLIWGYLTKLCLYTLKSFIFVSMGSENFPLCHKHSFVSNSWRVFSSNDANELSEANDRNICQQHKTQKKIMKNVQNAKHFVNLKSNFALLSSKSHYFL